MKARAMTRQRLMITGAGGFAALLTLAACGGTSGYSAGPRAAPATPAPTGTAALAIEHTSLGDALADNNGRTVYVLTADSPGHSACTGTCLQSWPIVPAGSTSTATDTVAGVRAELGALARPDGTKQLTVGGMPVYTYVGDTAGATNGAGIVSFGGTWWAVSPAGQAITTSGGAATSPSMSGGGRY